MFFAMRKAWFLAALALLSLGCAKRSGPSAPAEPPSAPPAEAQEVPDAEAQEEPANPACPMHDGRCPAHDGSCPMLDGGVCPMMTDAGECPCPMMHEGGVEPSPPPEPGSEG